MKNALGQEMRTTEHALSVIADALHDPDGPTNLTEAVFVCAENLSKIAKALESIDNKMSTLINVVGDE